MFRCCHLHQGAHQCAAFPRQQWFRERASMLPLHVHACLVRAYIHTIVYGRVDLSILPQRNIDWQVWTMLLTRIPTPFS
jgi:hypothetical protein